MNPLVSICIPVYGVEKHIGKCCQTLFEQSYSNIEYIFVDDCTPDDSVNIIKQVLYNYPQRKGSVKIIRHIKNKGLSAARNTAIEVATGKYLMHVDSDDYLDLNVVEYLVKKALVEQADVVLCDIRYVYSDKMFTKYLRIPETKEECVRQTLTFQINVCVWGVLYSTDLFKNNNILFIEGLNFGEDYVTKPRILYYANKIVHCEGCYYNYVQYNASSYTSSYKSKNIEDLTRAIEILADFFREKEDYSKYRDSLNMAYLYVKIHLLIDICLHRKQVWSYLPQVASLYRDKEKYSETLSLPFKIFIILAKYRCYNLLWVYASVASWVNQVLKKEK